MMTVAPHIRSIVDRDGAVILNVESDQFFSTNPVGAYIWTHLQKGEDLDQIASALAKDTETDLSVVSADINEFVSELKAKHLLNCSI
jgi:hypothetical protein